jgi:hypothetical protein
MTEQEKSSSMKKRKNRTWGRELSFACLVFLCVLAWQDKIEAVKALSVPMTPLIVAAFVVKDKAVQERLKGREYEE